MPAPARYLPRDLGGTDAAHALPSDSPSPSAMREQLQAAGLDLEQLPALEDVGDEALPAVMNLLATAVGAPCEACHLADRSAETPTKRVARKMWDELVRGLSLADGQPLFCDSCHRGRLTFLSRGDQTALADWMQRAFVDGLRRRDGGPHDCATCHGDPFVADFLRRWAVAGDAPPDQAADLALPSADLGAPDLSPAPGGCQVSVNEVQVAGAAGPDDEFIELFNACGTTIALADFTLVYRSANGTTETTLLRFTTQSLSPRGYLVAAGPGYSGFASVGYAGALASAGGGVALRAPSGALVDTIAYGNASNAFVVGSPGKAPSPGRALARSPDGAHQHADQALDLVVTTPTPGAANAP